MTHMNSFTIFADFHESSRLESLQHSNHCQSKDRHPMLLSRAFATPQYRSHDKSHHLCAHAVEADPSTTPLVGSSIPSSETNQVREHAPDSYCKVHSCEVCCGNLWPPQLEINTLYLAMNSAHGHKDQRARDQRNDSCKQTGRTLKQLSINCVHFYSHFLPKFFSHEPASRNQCPVAGEQTLTLISVLQS